MMFGSMPCVVAVALAPMPRVVAVAPRVVSNRAAPMPCSIRARACRMELDGPPTSQPAVDISSAVASSQQLLLEQRCFISIAGLIGAGKSTLAAALGDATGLPVYYEPIAEVSTNSYLADFYDDMPKYSFGLQIHLLNKRFRQQQEIVWSDKGAIQDRSIYEDAVFARVLADDGLMDPRDYETYVSLFASMSRFMQRPDVIVYLDVSPEESLRRIRSRQRDCESGMTLDYLVKLHAAYEAFISDISKSMQCVHGIPTRAPYLSPPASHALPLTPLIDAPRFVVSPQRHPCGLLGVPLGGGDGGRDCEAARRLANLAHRGSQVGHARDRRQVVQCRRQAPRQAGRSRCKCSERAVNMPGVLVFAWPPL